MGKAAVTGLLERPGPDRTSRVKVSVVPTIRKGTLRAEVRQHVAPGSALCTGALRSYKGLAPDDAHEVIHHAESCVQGRIHTNGLKNFWSLIKRAIKSTYVSVAPFRLFRCSATSMPGIPLQRAQARRWRAIRVKALRGTVGRRLTHGELTSAPV